MTKFIFALMFVCVFTNISSAQKNSQATAQEKKELFQLILNNDEEIKQAVADRTIPADLQRDFKVEKKDFNKDGQPEYVAVVNDGGICGALANCPTFVYQKASGQYQLLLRTFGRELVPEKTVTNRFYDLRSEGGDTAMQGSFTIYKFGGDHYQASGCFTRIYAVGRKKEKIIPIKCEENTASTNEENFDGRDFSGIKGDFETVGAVAHVKIKAVELAAEAAHPLYKVESEIIETFKGKITKGESFTFYFNAEEDYNPQQLTGKEWIVFLEKERPVPNGGNGWYELENSKLRASEKLSAELRKLKNLTKKV